MLMWKDFFDEVLRDYEVLVGKRLTHVHYAVDLATQGRLEILE